MSDVLRVARCVAFCSEVKQRRMEAGSPYLPEASLAKHYTKNGHIPVVHSHFGLFYSCGIGKLSFADFAAPGSSAASTAWHARSGDSMRPLVLIVLMTPL